MELIYVYTWRWHLISSSLTISLFFNVEFNRSVKYGKGTSSFMLHLCFLLINLSKLLPTSHSVPCINFLPHVQEQDMGSLMNINSDLSFSQFSSVQSLSRVRLFVTPWIAARQASLSITISWSLLKLISIKSVMPSSHLILCHPLLLLPTIPPSIRVFSNESTLRMRWPKYWSFSFSISPSNEHPGLISFRMDCLDLLAVQGTLKSLLQHHSSKPSISSQSNSHIHTWPLEKP